MAQDFEIVDAFRRTLGREPTGEEIQRGLGFSVGQLNDAANIRSLAGQQSQQDIYNESLRLAREAAQPAVDTLKSRIAPTEQQYAQEATRLEGTKDPLNTRYDSLIQQIVDRQTQSENRQTVATKNELAKRGVSSVSGIGAQEVVNAVNPITQEFSGLLSETGYNREKALSDIDALVSQLGLNKVDTVNAINQAIASVQSGAGNQGLTLGLNTINQNQARAAQEVANQIAQQELDLKKLQGKSSDYSIVNVGGVGYVYDPATNSIINTFGGGGGGGGDGIQQDIKTLQDQLNPNSGDNYFYTLPGL